MVERNASTTLVQIAPGMNPDVIKLLNEVMSIKEWADKRDIAKLEDVKDATNDLSVIAKLKKVIEEKRKDYTDPLNTHLKDINNAFKLLSEPLEQANSVTRQKVLAYNAGVERQRQEAEAIEREKLELARRENELKGEHTVDLSPVERPAETPARVRTDLGMTSKMTVRKWAVEDITQVPPEYLIVDAAKVTKQVKAGIGAIPGIRIYEEETLRVSAK